MSTFDKTRKQFVNDGKAALVDGKIEMQKVMDQSVVVGMPIDQVQAIFNIPNQTVLDATAEQALKLIKSNRVNLNELRDWYWQIFNGLLEAEGCVASLAAHLNIQAPKVDASAFVFTRGADGMMTNGHGLKMSQADVIKTMMPGA